LGIIGDSRFADAEEYGEIHGVEAEEAAYHSGKRYRSSDWPLPNTTPQARRQSVRSENTPASSPCGRTSSYRAHPSKFIEGSMNDRVSQKPPTPYIGGDEELREQYHQDIENRGRKIAQPRKITHRLSRTSSHVEKPDTTRHSTIFRFGKSIAANINPANWKIWTKPQQEDIETPEQKVLKERRDRAEAIYLELKRNGQFRDSAVPPVFKSEEVLAKHDSGIVLTAPGRTSSDSYRSEKRNGMVFLDPPQFDTLPGSPGSNASGSIAGSVKKSGLRFKNPLPSSIRKIEDGNGGSNVVRDSGRQARRIPSRKDLQKQQKLVKRVSDLEMRLDAARRHLSDALGEPLPAIVAPLRAPSATRVERPRFVPGALATLPSERLLAGYVPADDGELEEGASGFEVSDRIGRALTKDESMKDIAASNSVDIGKDLAGEKHSFEVKSGDAAFGNVEITSGNKTESIGKDRSVRASTQ